MSRARHEAFDIVAHAAWMFAAWAAMRVMLSIYLQSNGSHTEALLRIVSDVEIHSLRFKWGWDFAAFAFFAAVAATVQKVRRRHIVIPAVVATLLAGALSIAMVLYPALTLSGRLSSPFTGVARSLNETKAFAATVTLALVTSALLLSRLGRDRPVHHQAS